MMKTLIGAAVAAVCLALPAGAVVPQPPADTSQQWWSHPLGCEYSRAGRPGEIVWYLIVNTRKPGCPTYIAVQHWGDVYQAQGPIMVPKR